MAEEKALMDADDANYSDEEALIYMTNEKHPKGSVKKAEILR